jgi:hypothetical protein
VAPSHGAEPAGGVHCLLIRRAASGEILIL